MANRILTVDLRRVKLATSGGGSTISGEEGSRRSWLVPSSTVRQYVTANKRVAAIGGANAHSRPDRLSFVTSFTVSNDTNCFWMPSSYAMPGRAPGTDSLYYSSFLLRTPSAFRLLFRPILSTSCFYLRNDRAIYLFVFPSRSVFLALVRGVVRRLNSIC